MQCNQNVKIQAVMMNFGSSVLGNLTANDYAPRAGKFLLSPTAWLARQLLANFH